MATPFDTRLASIVKNSLTDVLKPRGFSKRGNVYRREVDELLWLIDFQKSRWNYEEKASFTLNFGIFVPGLMSTYGNRPDPVEPQVPACCIHGRVGRLMPEGLDRWWELRADHPIPTWDEQVTVEIRKCILEYTLPFLEKFRRRKDVADYLEATRGQEAGLWPPNDIIRLTYLGILYHLDGDRDRCRDALADAKLKAAKSPARADIVALANRLCST